MTEEALIFKELAHHFDGGGSSSTTKIVSLPVMIGRVGCASSGLEHMGELNSNRSRCLQWNEREVDRCVGPRFHTRSLSWRVLLLESVPLPSKEPLVSWKKSKHHFEVDLKQRAFR